MSKKKFINGLLLIIFCIGIFLGINEYTNSIDKVDAASAISITNAVSAGGDLVKVTINNTGNKALAYFLVGTSTGNATKFQPESISGTEFYVSMMNGTYNIWAYDTAGNQSNPYSYTMNSSCGNSGVTNATGSGTVDMCAKINYLGTVSDINSGTPLVTCADGYYISTVKTELIANGCTSGNYKFSPYNITQRFCKKTYSYSCVKKQETQPGSISSELSSLSLSNGNLTPSFASSTKTYAASVNADSVTINATLKDSKASFVNGYGPRTVNLKSGSNVFYIRVAGTDETEYKITINKPSSSGSSSSSKSSVNTLSALNLNSGILSPSFNSNTNNYTVNVDAQSSALTIGANLSDSKSSFVNGYGPRTVNLKYGENTIYVKVKAQSGNVRVYTLSVNRPLPQSDAPSDEQKPENSGSKALLSSLELDNGSIEFEQNVFDYNVTVENSIINVIPKAVAADETDKVEVNGGTELVVGSNELTIKVTSADESTSNVYTIYIIRKEEEETISTNSLLKDLTVNNHKFKFDAKVTDYDITLKNNETELEINATVADDKSTITVEGNENLTTGSEVKIRVTAESGDYTDYFLKIKGYEKGGNLLLTIFVIIIIILVLAYIVLRFMGYKIVLNFQAIKDWFGNLFRKG